MDTLRKRSRPTVNCEEQLAIPYDILAEICVRYRVCELAVFGSVARGESRPDSDVDLLVLFDSDARIGLVAFARLRQELTDAIGRPVDLVPKDGLKPAIKASVLAEAQMLYAA